jgi:hypothetical protein
MNQRMRFRETRQHVQDVGFEVLGREERDDADHRADAERNAPAALELQLVVVEAVLVVPEPATAEAVHGVDDRDEVLEELRRQVLAGGVVAGELDRDRQHGGAVEGHPRGAVGLLEVAARRQRPRAVEDADVVEAEEAAAEEVLARDVLPVHPPGEVQEVLLEDAGEEEAVARAALAGHLVDPPRRPGRHGRVHVAECPLVGGGLAVRVRVPLARHQDELLLREVRDRR